MYFFAEFYRKAVVRVYFYLRKIGETILDPLYTVLQGKHVVLGGIVANPDDDFIKKIKRSGDHIYVSDGNGIETAGEESYP